MELEPEVAKMGKMIFNLLICGYPFVQLVLLDDGPDIFEPSLS